MIQASSLYKDVIEAINVEVNGQFPYAMFNRYSRIAELLLLDWITGDIKGQQPPEPYTTMKDKDFVAPFISAYSGNAVNGKMSRPKDYYGFENMYIIGGTKAQSACVETDDDSQDSVCNTPIELLDGSQFYTRCKTYISALKPSYKKPIAKLVGKEFEFLPKDIGSVSLEYYRYPKFANIVTKVDPVFQDEVVDEVATTNYEWDENARSILIWFIVDRFANRVSSKGMKELNILSNKTPH